MDLTAVSHITIQREFAIEFLDDLLEYEIILLERIRVKGAHHAATAATTKLASTLQAIVPELRFEPNW